MSKVTGAQEVADDLHRLGQDVSHDLAALMPRVAQARADSLAPTRAHLEPPAVNASGATLNYSGVIAADAFEGHIVTDLEDRAVAAADDAIDNAITRAGLT